MNAIARLGLAMAALVLCATNARAQKHELKFSFMGAEAGSNVYEVRPDGSFVSETTLTLAGTKITSKLSGSRKDDVITAFTLEQAAGPNTVKIVVRDGKATLEASVAGKPNEVKQDTKDFKPAKAVFANFHPALSASIAANYTPTTAGTQKMDLLILDGAVSLAVDVSRRAAKVVEVGGKRETAQVYQVRFPNVDMDLYVTEDGQAVAWDVPAQMLKAVAPGWEDLVVDPATKMPELSQPTLKAAPAATAKIKMRDGVELTHDIAKPAEEGKYPVILVRTPYGRKAQMAGADWWAKRGYVYIAQDVRGRGDSAGDWEPFVHERADGYDTLDWISKQSWCSGSVGMIGGSYVGWVQWWAAVEGHPALKCIVPQVSPPDPFYNFPVDHGIPFLYGGVWWAVVVKDKGQLTELPKIEKLDGLKELPITKVTTPSSARMCPS